MNGEKFVLALGSSNPLEVGSKGLRTNNLDGLTKHNQNVCVLFYQLNSSDHFIFQIIAGSYYVSLKILVLISVDNALNGHCCR